MRPDCFTCTRKHLGQAIVIMQEVQTGYSHFRFIAVGHLAEAEAEIMKIDLELSRRIRKARLVIEDGGDPDLLHFIIEINNRKDVNDKQDAGYVFWDDDTAEVNLGKKKGRK